MRFWRRRRFRAWFCGCEDFYTGNGRVALSVTKPGMLECHGMDDCGWVRVTMKAAG